MSKACFIFKVSQTCYRYLAKLKEQNVVIADWLTKLTNENKTWGFILVDFSLPAQRVLRGLDQLIEWRGKLKRIRSDNGPEYISDLMEVWCEQHKIEHVFTQPGNPQQNAYVERFNRTVRYECLNQYLFRELEDVQDYTTAWQHFYNHERPHMSVDGKPPKFKQ